MKGASESVQPVWLAVSLIYALLRSFGVTSRTCSLTRKPAPATNAFEAKRPLRGRFALGDQRRPRPAQRPTARTERLLPALRAVVGD